MDFLIREPQPDTLAEVDEPEPVIDYTSRKLCPCGRMFTPYRPYQRYHNDACRIKFESKRPSRYIKKVYVTKQCPVCGTEFKSNDDKKVYCSHECYLKHEEQRHVAVEERVCVICGQAFITTHWSKRYCSDTCRRAARRVK